MDEQEKQFEEGPDMAGKNEKKPREAGHGEDGEPSLEALKRWLIWAGAALIVCLAVACVLAAVSSGQNKKPVVIMEVEEESALEFSLNRKGTVLETSDAAFSDWESVELNELKKASLEECCMKLLENLFNQGYLESGKGVLFTVREAEPGVHVDTERMAEEISVYAETFLKKRQAEGTVYVGAIAEDEEASALSETYKTSVGKAAFVQNLIDKNIKIKAADGERLCGLPVWKLAEEISENKYSTSFIVVTAGRVYQVKEETQAKTTADEAAGEGTGDGSGQDETAGETSGEISGQTAGETSGKTPEDGASSGTETSAERDGGSEPEESKGLENTGEELKPGERPSEDRGTENEAIGGTSAASDGGQTGGTKPQAPTETTPAPGNQPQMTQAPATQAPTVQTPETQAPVTQPPATQAPATQVPATQAPETQPSAVQPPTETTPAPETTQAAETAAPQETPESTSASGVLSPSGGPKHVGPGYVEEVVPIN